MLSTYVCFVDVFEWVTCHDFHSCLEHSTAANTNTIALCKCIWIFEILFSSQDILGNRSVVGAVGALMMS